MADFDRESMLEMFTFEMSQLVEQLEQTIIQAESGYAMDQINEIFRIMHTIKGSAAMMMFDGISTTAHAMEDLFFYMREENPQGIDYSQLTDFVLEGMDFIKVELGKLEEGAKPDGDGTEIIKRIKNYLAYLKGQSGGPAAASTAPAQQGRSESVATPAQKNAGRLNHYNCKIFFEDGCEMENIRSYTLVHNLGDLVEQIEHIPEDVIDEASIEYIRKNGFFLKFASKLPYKEIHAELAKTIYLREMRLTEEEGGGPAVLEAAGMHEQHRYQAVVRFNDGVEMENVRAYALVQHLSEEVANITHIPADVIPEDTVENIRKNGFIVFFETSMDLEQAKHLFDSTAHIKSIDVTEIGVQKAEVHGAAEAAPAPPQAADAAKLELPKAPEAGDNQAQAPKKQPTQHVISVNVSKLDQLLNLMGELVIAEAMVTQNPELEALELESFHKEALQLRKIINDVQDTVMSMRMVPLSTTFFKMHRIVRDMCKQLSKDVALEISGEETEVDKNIIEHIADPLMHIIRNSVDHGIEKPEVRKSLGKPEKGVVKLEAKNSGGDVLIIIKDDGAGLNKDKIMAKAKANGLLRKAESEYTDKEIYQFVFLPGFSTNEKVTSYSGRGVGMDVVSTNLETVGGSVIVDSIPGQGSTFTLKIPLTLAIIEGMTIRMGGAKYTIPIISIKQSFKATKGSVFKDPSGNEMITVRGEVYNLVRLYEYFNVESSVTEPGDGIIIMLENGDQTVCVLADELIGEQQVVVKTLSKYIKKVKGISGCTLLGNGDISLIIDVIGFFDK